MEEWETIDFNKLTEKDVIALLRKQWVPKDFFYNLLGKKELFKFYSIQKEMINHPHCPQEISMNILPNLLPIDLLRLAKNMRISPFIRRQAETIFIQKWPKIPMGEKISHARRATPYVLKNLKSEDNPMVLKAILENPSLTEDILLEIINSPGVSINALKEIFNSHWKNRYSIKLAIVRSPSTPISIILQMIPLLQKKDLQLLINEPDTHYIIKEKAKEILKKEEI